MAEDQSSGEAIAVGLSANDISPNVYEGGFKTWECSIDLANYLSTLLPSQSSAHRDAMHIIEVILSVGSPESRSKLIESLASQVGAGTALPSLVIFHCILNNPIFGNRTIHISLADYNQSVLETASVPNLLLTWHFARSVVTPPLEGDLDITEDLINRFLDDLSANNIHLSGISGAWGGAFCDLLKPFNDLTHQHRIDTIFLASETIYSPSSIRPFTEVLLNSLRGAEKAGGTTKAFVAAKRVYFGVGGGVDEFLTVLGDFGGKSANAWESVGPGVRRVILEITVDERGSD